MGTKRRTGRIVRRVCVLCGGAIKEVEEHSTYRVEGEIRGFRRTVDLQKSFHNACLTKESGINEIARAQVLDYLEAVEFNRSILEDLKSQNLQRANSILREIRWKQKYDKPQ